MAGINYRPPMERPPTDFYEWFHDFLGYDASNFVVTDTGSGTQVVNDAAGGVLVMTTGATENDHDYMQWDGEDNGSVAEIFGLSASKEFYIGARFKIDDVTQADFALGLQVTDTTPLATTDGVWIGTDDGDANLDVHVAASSSQTNAAAVATLINDTYVTVELVYGGNSQPIQIFVDGVKVGGIAVTNLPTTELTASWAIETGEGEARVLSIDWIRIVVER